MKSPFPGMDPYVESRSLWEDFHVKLIGEIERALAAAVPARYAVRLGERAYVVLAGTEGKKEHHFVPDVGVVAPRSPQATPEKGGGTAVASAPTSGQPLSVRAFIETPYREAFIEIFEATPELRLVTCIEVLSPSNKDRGSKGWKRYLRKRQGLLLGEASLVEIDLLRGGQRMPMLDPLPESPYYVLVAREEDAPYCRVWPGHFRHRLPVIPIPLTRPDPDVSIDLQALVEAVYTRSHYDAQIDYTKPLSPTLTAEEAAWLSEQLRASSSQPAPPPSTP